MMIMKISVLLLLAFVSCCVVVIVDAQGIPCAQEATDMGICMQGNPSVASCTSCDALTTNLPTGEDACVVYVNTTCTVAECCPPCEKEIVDLFECQAEVAGLTGCDYSECDGSNSGGLSTGAIVGIAIGGAVGLCLICGLIYFCFIQGDDEEGGEGNYDAATKEEPEVGEETPADEPADDEA